MIEKSILSVFDLFAGAGGFGLGFEMAGFDLKLSLEKDDWAAETLLANASPGEHNIIKADIRDLSNIADIRAVANRAVPDVIIGGPPCQGFSLAGPPKDPADPRNTLFINFAKWVECLEPQVFVIENVSGILGRRNEKGDRVIDIILTTFRNLGYHVEIWRLNALNFGVPQSRERVFIVGNVYGLPIGSPPFTHDRAIGGIFNVYALKPAVTVSEAIGDLPVIFAGEGSEIMEYDSPAVTGYQEWARANSREVNNHVSMVHTKRIVERYAHLQRGERLESIPEDLRVRKRNGKGILSTSSYQSNYRHLKGDQVSFTIPASFYSTFIHPFLPRNITSREAARLQSFPDEYIFKGKRTMISAQLQKKRGLSADNNLSQYNQIGNAVPPLLSKAIAQHIQSFIRQHSSNMSFSANEDSREFVV
ncbi:DNA cytosine methyltransferase [Dyadobacter sp. CY261]|uniref:DNA cytosine methyltransferase n=1 Tax=Dyadobacter sp. CY261 TaxID=2907203 RepID=UPI001F3B7CA4|nr:DNA cytosine methyltransferase [Dyadobacter sp. CY261]MCF0072478.1 DNA cytosine methyltransferase [Dyadobacter sp. CY261]